MADTRKYEVMLAAIIAARGTSFIFSKMLLETMDPFSLLALRFLLAFGVLAVIFRRRLAKMTRRDLGAGILCGGLFFCVMTCEYSALGTTSTGVISLLENCSIIFVPLLEAAIWRRLPTGRAVGTALAALAGVFCITVQEGGLSGGVGLGLLAALLYATAIIVTGVVSRRAADTLCIGIMQVGALGFFGLAAAFIFETPALPAQPAQWAMVLALALVCTCFGYTLQPVAQRYVPAERAGLFCAINPAVAAVLGAVVLHERFGPLSILGLGLILGSIVCPYIHFGRRQKAENRA